MTPEQQLEMLIDALQLMGAPVEEQMAALPKYVCLAEEVVGNFADAYLLLSPLRRNGLVSDAAAQAIDRVNSVLQSMPEDEALEDPENLRSNPMWVDARLVARSALAEMGVLPEPPILRYVHYVPGE